MPILVLLIGGLAVFAIAAVAVGRVTANLAASPSRAVFDADQALEFVAEALPADVTAELSYDDVRSVLRLFHDYLHERGVATTAGDANRDLGPQVIDPDQAADYVVHRSSLQGIPIRRSHAHSVIDAQMAYFEAIGALGGVVELDDGPD